MSYLVNFHHDAWFALLVAIVISFGAVYTELFLQIKFAHLSVFWILCRTMAWFTVHCVRLVAICCSHQYTTDDIQHTLSYLLVQIGQVCSCLAKGHNKQSVF